VAVNTFHRQSAERVSYHTSRLTYADGSHQPRGR
jgi:hypothetical protein